MPRLVELKRNLQKLLKKYEAIKDIIIYGSFVKGRDSPKDIDLAIIIEKKDLSLVPLIKKELGLSNVHLEFVVIDEIYTSILFLSLLNEGYSAKKDQYLRDILNIKPMRLYSYDLKHLNKSQKTLFGIALKKALNKIKGEKVSTGAVLVPIAKTSYFEDFLAAWDMKYKTKEWTVI